MSRGDDFGFVNSDVNLSGPFDSDSEILQEGNHTFEATNVPTMEVFEGPLSPLSDNQEILLSILQIVSSLLSLVGSCVIVYKIIRKLQKEKTTTPYERIVLGLSSFDILASITFGLSPFLLPSETSQRVWAIGTKTTCSMLGFMSQLACIWAVWYNVLLSFYYLLTVRFQIKPKDFAKKYEFWMHLSGAIFFPITAVFGLIGDWYSEEALTMMCWIGDVPKDCRADGVPCHTQLVAYIFGMIPTAICFFSLIINNTVIYIFVRRTLKVETLMTVRSPETVIAEDSEKNDIYVRRTLTGRQITVRNSDIVPADDSENSKIEQTDMEDCTTGRLTLQRRLTKEVAIQSLLYVTAYLLTIVPAILLSVLDAAIAYNEEDQGSLYPLLILNSMLLPLQGFFNVFIYVKPSYSRFRNKHPEEPILFVLKHALFNSDIPRLSEPATIVGSATRTGKVSGRKRANNLEAIPEGAIAE